MVSEIVGSLFGRFKSFDSQWCGQPLRLLQFTLIFHCEEGCWRSQRSLSIQKQWECSLQYNRLFRHFHCWNSLPVEARLLCCPRSRLKKRHLSQRCLCWSHRCSSPYTQGQPHFWDLDMWNKSGWRMSRSIKP